MRGSTVNCTSNGPEGPLASSRISMRAPDHTKDGVPSWADVATSYARVFSGQLSSNAGAMASYKTRAPHRTDQRKSPPRSDGPTETWLNSHRAPGSIGNTAAVRTEKRPCRKTDPGRDAQRAYVMLRGVMLGLVVTTSE